MIEEKRRNGESELKTKLLLLLILFLYFEAQLLGAYTLRIVMLFC